MGGANVTRGGGVAIAVVLAVAGGGLGLLFAAWWAQGLSALLPPETRLLFPITLDGDKVMVDTGSVQEGPPRGANTWERFAEPVGPLCVPT